MYIRAFEYTCYTIIIFFWKKNQIFIFTLSSYINRKSEF